MADFPLPPSWVNAQLRAGIVIPAHPLALSNQGKLDLRRQRALTRYYHAAGAGGVAVGVHTTQFEIRNPEFGMTDEVLFKQNNSISEIAWAFTVYSFVPYLGILFVPFSFVCGLIGVYSSRKNPQFGGRKLSLFSLVLSFIVLFAQIFFWWLLYFIPQITRKL